MSFLLGDTYYPLSLDNLFRYLLSTKTQTTSRARTISNRPYHQSFLSTCTSPSLTLLQSWKSLWDLRDSCLTLDKNKEWRRLEMLLPLDVFFTHQKHSSTLSHGTGSDLYVVHEFLDLTRWRLRTVTSPISRGRYTYFTLSRPPEVVASLVLPMTNGDGRFRVSAKKILVRNGCLYFSSLKSRNVIQMYRVSVV